MGADQLRLRQALVNLVDNALRYGGGERGAAGVRAARPPRSSRSPTPAPGSRRTSRAFERFARGDAARARGGAGLGLAIVRAIAEAHGGSAEILRDGPGATVRITLPSEPQRHLSGRS